MKNSKNTTIKATVNNLSTLKVSTLRVLCKLYGVRGYSHAKKEEVIDMLLACKDFRKEYGVTPSRKEAVAEAKDTLGADYKSAMNLYKARTGKTGSLKASAVNEATSNWQMFKEVECLIEEGGVPADKIEEYFRYFSSLLGVYKDKAPAEVPVEEQVTFLEEAVKEFQEGTATEVLHKASVEILKMDVKSIDWDINGVAYFDSRKAGSEEGMRYVLSSEGGISRILVDTDREQIVVHMDTAEQEKKELAPNAPKEEIERIAKKWNDIRKDIFARGIVDIATGKKYLRTTPSASSTRHANFPFILADDKAEVYDLWLGVTKFSSLTDLVKNVGKEKDGKTVLNFAKFKARIAQNGANSLPVARTATEEVANKLRNARALFAPDCEGVIYTPYKEQVDTGVMRMVTPDGKIVTENLISGNITEETGSPADYSRTTTPSDGQSLCSVHYGAWLASAMKIISNAELIIFETEMAKCSSIEDMLKNRELMRIINKIPKAWQIRQSAIGGKGMLIVFPLEFFDETKDYDVILTDGFCKYGDKDWSAADVEVCAYLKRKSEWVNMNVQFINSLVNYEDPSFLTPIVDYWHNFAMSTLEDSAMKLKFHNIVSSMGDGKEDDIRLATALKTDISLRNERYMVSLAEKQYTKFYEDLSCGRMAVPGRYSYMVTDPAYVLNQLLGTNLPELKAGEYWMNGKTCKAGLFRSPLIAPFEAQKVQLVSDNFYDVFYKDMTIFNGHDGIWELMGGGDFDGDTCACIPEDTSLGKVIVDGIGTFDYVMLHNSRSAEMKEFNLETFWEDLAEFDAKASKADRTGLITNYATKAIEIWHSLKAYIYYAKKSGCEGIYFKHPSALPVDENGHPDVIKPHSDVIDGKKVFVAKGFAYMSPATKFKWVDVYEFGFVSFDRVKEIMDDFMRIVEYLNPVQGDEIDGAKTGFYPELFHAIEVVWQSIQTSDRNAKVGKEVSWTAKRNAYCSYSPLAIVNEVSKKKYEEFKVALQDKASDKTAVLKNLLTEEELAGIEYVSPATGKSLIDYLKKERKVIYGRQRGAIRNDDCLTEEEKIKAYSALKDGYDKIDGTHVNGEIDNLRALAKTLKITDEAMAVACYIATNEKNGNQNSGLSYGWLLFDELLSVFARANESVVLYRVPANTEEVSVKNGAIYINGTKRANVDAEDCDNVLVRNINGRLFAYITRSNKANRVSGTVRREVYTIGTLMGFKYNGFSVADFKTAIKVNGDCFDVEYDTEGNLIAVINGVEYCRLQSSNSASRYINELAGHKVKMTTSPLFKETEEAIKNLVVRPM